MKSSGMQSQGKSKIRTWVDATPFWQLIEKAKSQTVQGFSVYKKNIHIYVTRDLWGERAWKVSPPLLYFNVALDDL